MEPVPQLRPAEEWWVHRSEGDYKPLPHRCNSRSKSIGPFSCRATAEMKRQELLLRDEARRDWITLLVCTVAVTGISLLFAWLDGGL